jgi:rubredoxin
VSNDPEAKPLVCPECGGPSEDFTELTSADSDALGFDWECPACGSNLADKDLMTTSEYRYWNR